MDQHTLIGLLKDLAIELGRTPTRKEFADKHGFKWEVHFGNWGPFVKAAGLEPTHDRKINNSIFEVSLHQHLEGYTPRPRLAIEAYPTVASISDIHWPFPNKIVINRYLEYVGDEKPEWAVINGDGWDMYSHAKFPRSHNIFRPQEEEQLSRQMNVDFWEEVKRRSPDSKCFQLMGNHDIRPMKRVLEQYPEAEDWIKDRLSKLFTFDGVTTIFDPRQELMVGSNIAIFHGYRSGLGDHRDYTLMNCMNGHTHIGGVVFRTVRGILIWELNSGLAGDPEAKGLTYTPQKITKWTPGFSAVDKIGPRFVPC